MRLLLVVLAALALYAFPADKKKNAAVEVLTVKALHDGTDVTVDGRVRATADKPIVDLLLGFEFLASGKQVITTRKVAIDEPSLENGDEAAFHASTTYPRNAIQILIRAYRGDMELVVSNPGPFPIEN
jgi:hypothetical protein